MDIGAHERSQPSPKSFAVTKKNDAPSVVIGVQSLVDLKDVDTDDDREHN